MCMHLPGVTTQVDAIRGKNQRRLCYYDDIYYETLSFVEMITQQNVLRNTKQHVKITSAKRLLVYVSMTTSAQSTLQFKYIRRSQCSDGQLLK